jgi:Fic family protein
VSAVLRAILAHLYIAWIHPFGNGNGRTARLVEVQILASSGLVPIVATNLLSDHYNKTRTRYYEMLDRASRADDVFGFVQYALEGLVDELRSQVQVVKRHNMHIAWESYVYQVFNTCVPSTARSRQRQVALALPGNRYLRKDEIIELNTRIAREYARCGERTPARDLNELHRLGLVERQGRTFRSKKEIILAFRPPVGGSLLLDGSEDL